MGFKCPHCTEGIEGVIAKSRFDDVYNERKALKASTAILEDSPHLHHDIPVPGGSRVDPAPWLASPR